VEIGSRPKGVQGVSYQKADAQYNYHCCDGLKHKRLPARSSSVTKDLSAQSKEFIELLKFDSRLRIFSNGAVAPRQLNFCSCFGTTHFDLRRAQRVLSSVHRGWYIS
jgi:hypothetical protein